MTHDSQPPMTEARAREIIEASRAYRHWRFGWMDDDDQPAPSRVALDSVFTADQLEAFAWWLRNKPGEEL